jgi:hypothetical protein
MSIRLRLTLLYSTILALTLLIFGAALYTIQAQTTMNALKQDLSGRSDTFVQSFLRAVLNPFDPRLQPPLLDWLSGDQAFRSLREREIIRVLDRSGALLASPMEEIKGLFHSRRRVWRCCSLGDRCGKQASKMDRSANLQPTGAGK